MVWAILWGLIIGWSGNATAGILAFFVIWYFVDNRDSLIAAVNGKKQRQSELEELEKKQNEPAELDKQIKDYEESAEELKKYTLMDSLGIGKNQFEFLLRRTGDDYINLKSRLWAKLNWRVDLARDWYEYAQTINELSGIDESISVDDNSRYDSLLERKRQAHLKRHDLEKMFQQSYGREFEDRWEEWNKQVKDE